MDDRWRTTLHVVGALAIGAVGSYFAADWPVAAANAVVWTVTAYLAYSNAEGIPDGVDVGFTGRRHAWFFVILLVANLAINGLIDLPVESGLATGLLLVGIGALGFQAAVDEVVASYDLAVPSERPGHGPEAQDGKRPGQTFVSDESPRREPRDPGSSASPFAGDEPTTPQGTSESGSGTGSPADADVGSLELDREGS